MSSTYNAEIDLPNYHYFLLYLLLSITYLWGFCIIQLIYIVSIYSFLIYVHVRVFKVTEILLFVYSLFVAVCIWILLQFVEVLRVNEWIEREQYIKSTEIFTIFIITCYCYGLSSKLKILKKQIFNTLSKTIFLPQTTVYTKPIKKKCLNKKFNHSFCLIILGTINKLLLLLIFVVAFKYEITLMWN